MATGDGWSTRWNDELAGHESRAPIGSGDAVYRGLHEEINLSTRLLIFLLLDSGQILWPNPLHCKLFTCRYLNLIYFSAVFTQSKASSFAVQQVEVETEFMSPAQLPCLFTNKVRSDDDLSTVCNLRLPPLLEHRESHHQRKAINAKIPDLSTNWWCHLRLITIACHSSIRASLLCV